MGDKILLNRRVVDWIKSISFSVMKENNGRYESFHYIPFWFKDGDSDDCLEVFSFENLPEYIKEELSSIREADFYDMVENPNTYNVPSLENKFRDKFRKLFGRKNE